jgi:hypothetical protein
MATTKDIQALLLEIRENLKELLVSAWLHEKKENPQDIDDTVHLMAEVVYSLSAEIDSYSRSLEDASDAGLDKPPEAGAAAADDADLLELEAQPDDEDDTAHADSPVR